MKLLWAWTFAFIASLSSILFGYNLTMVLLLSRMPLFQTQIQGVNSTECHIKVLQNCEQAISNIQLGPKCTQIAPDEYARLTNDIVSVYSDSNCSVQINSTKINGCMQIPSSSLFVSNQCGIPDKKISDFIKTSILFFLLGSLLGAIFLGFIADKIGRKPSFFVGGAIAVFAGLAQMMFVTVPIFMFCQFVVGVSVGFLCVVGSVYLSEIVGAKQRGSLVCWGYIMICEGISAAIFSQTLVISAFVGQTIEYQLTIGAQAVIGVLQILLAFVLSESPRWYALKGYSQAGLFALAKLNQKPVNEDMIARYQAIQETVTDPFHPKEASFFELFEKENFHTTLLALRVSIMQALTGAPIVGYFLLKHIELLTFNRNIGIYLNLTNVTAVFIAMYLVDPFGRKPFLIGGALALVPIYLSLMMNNFTIRVVALFFFVFVFSFSWGHIPWTYIPEIFPARLRAQGTGLSILVGWTFFTLILLITPTLFDIFDNQILIGCAISNVLVAVYSWLFVQETKKRDLEDIKIARWKRRVDVKDTK